MVGAFWQIWNLHFTLFIYLLFFIKLTFINRTPTVSNPPTTRKQRKLTCWSAGKPLDFLYSFINKPASGKSEIHPHDVNIIHHNCLFMNKAKHFHKQHLVRHSNYLYIQKLHNHSSVYQHLFSQWLIKLKLIYWLID